MLSYNNYSFFSLISRLRFLHHRLALRNFLHQRAQETSIRRKEKHSGGHFRPKTRHRHVCPFSQKNPGKFEVANHHNTSDDPDLQHNQSRYTNKAEFTHMMTYLCL